MTIIKKDEQLFKQELVDIPFAVADRLAKREKYVQQIKQIDEELNQVKADFADDIAQEEKDHIDEVKGRLTTIEKKVEDADPRLDEVIK